MIKKLTTHVIYFFCIAKDSYLFHGSLKLPGLTIFSLNLFFRTEAPTFVKPILDALVDDAIAVQVLLQPSLIIVN